MLDFQSTVGEPDLVRLHSKSSLCALRVQSEYAVHSTEHMLHSLVLPQIVPRLCEPPRLGFRAECQVFGVQYLLLDSLRTQDRALACKTSEEVSIA